MAMPPTTDATPVRLDQNAGDSSARSNLFADFLKTKDSDFKDQGNTTTQILHEMDKTIAGGSTAFSALPKMQLSENLTANDRSFNAAAAMAQPRDNDLAEEAMKRAFKNVA